MTKHLSEVILMLISSPVLFDLAPVIPKPEILASKADLINRILREAYVKDEYRPAYVGAMMLALWQSRGELRKSPDFVLSDINAACEAAFAKGGKAELAKSLHIDEANEEGKPAKPYLTAIEDDYSRMIVGYRLSFQKASALTTALTLRQAIWRKEDPRWSACGIPSVFYTDHGSDFTSKHMEQISAWS